MSIRGRGKKLEGGRHRWGSQPDQPCSHFVSIKIVCKKKRVGLRMGVHGCVCARARACVVCVCARACVCERVCTCVCVRARVCEDKKTLKIYFHWDIVPVHRDGTEGRPPHSPWSGFPTVQSSSPHRRQHAGHGPLREAPAYSPHEVARRCHAWSLASCGKSVAATSKMSRWKWVPLNGLSCAQGSCVAA